MNFDNEALIRAVVLAVGGGLLVEGVVRFFLHGSEKLSRWKTATWLLIPGFMIIAGVGIYYSWPSLVEVPQLDNLSEDKAKSILESDGLVPHAEPRYSAHTEKGRVIPKSQDPPAGQSVKKGRIVEFAIAINTPPPPSPPQTDSTKSISIFQPKSRGELILTKSGSGLYSGEVSGTSTGLKQEKDYLLLWLRPVDPPSDKSGWYLQRHPNGIRGLREDGSWIGKVQVGNAAWPPNDGHIIDVAVSVVDETTYTSLMAQGGEAMSQEAIGSIADMASEVKVKIRR